MTPELLCAKNCLKEIANNCEMTAFRKNWPLCKGYSPRKIVSLGRKLEFTKTWEKRVYNYAKVVVCKEGLQK